VHVPGHHQVLVAAIPDQAVEHLIPRTSALQARVPTITTIAGAEAAVEGMKFMDRLGVVSVQEMHEQLLRA
jgi:hypothetical protein